VHNRVLTAYGQDGWRLGDRLTLNYGLRWDAEYLIRPNGKLGQRFTDQWQPRVGFIYQLGTPGSQKLFGSYARFYEQFPLQLAQAYYDNPTDRPGRTLIIRYNHDPRVDPSGADTLFDSASSPS
jgi:outer membrane receptor protein involved in Fe transport